MTVEGADDLAGLRAVGRAVAAARDAMLAEVAPGVSTAELDEVGRHVLTVHGASSAPQLAYGFPAATCVSVNSEAAHGIPSPTRRLRQGDLVNVDVSAELDGYWADTGASRGVGTVEDRAEQLLSATRRAQLEAMRAARAGRPLGDVARAVQRRARRHGLRVIVNLTGHGIGRFIHEPPSVPNAERRDRTALHEGLVLAIEPFLSTGADHVVEDLDGWTLRTADGSPAAQFEHTVVVTTGRPIVLTASPASA